METTLKVKGKCLYCDKTFDGGKINGHLETHLNEKRNAPGASYFVKVEPYPHRGKSPYFLSLWIDGATSLQELDKFLRDIWLECCGHLSAFRMSRTGQHDDRDLFEETEMPLRDDRERYKELMEEEDLELSVTHKANKVFCLGLTLEYEYDFSSSTRLALTVLSEYPIKADAKIVLLSRNEPPEIHCQSCGKEMATQMCTAHGNGKNCLFCSKCAKKHEKTCGDFKKHSMPVVNSPRTCVCAYKGGRIDTERDGFFAKKTATR